MVSLGIGVYCTISSLSYAKTYNLEQGGTQLIKTNEKIDTIFVSSPNVADYEILDDNSFIIYAKGEGRAEITALGENGEVLTSD
ncbi:TPA: pilus assembly protein N-terminal domain-containing protein, partial [Pasteurella multocida]|nr:pilus assembly protein N-terminal domain-containing protein [Pasteurella multocida]